MGIENFPKKSIDEIVLRHNLYLMNTCSEGGLLRAMPPQGSSGRNPTQTYSFIYDSDGRIREFEKKVPRALAQTDERGPYHGTMTIHSEFPRGAKITEVTVQDEEAHAAAKGRLNEALKAYNRSRGHEE
jgi:hypothetical protein